MLEISMFSHVYTSEWHNLQLVESVLDGITEGKKIPQSLNFYIYLIPSLFWGSACRPVSIVLTFSSLYVIISLEALQSAGCRVAIAQALWVLQYCWPCADRLWRRLLTMLISPRIFGHRRECRLSKYGIPRRRRSLQHTQTRSSLDELLKSKQPKNFPKIIFMAPVLGNILTLRC